MTDIPAVNDSPPADIERHRGPRAFIELPDRDAQLRRRPPRVDLPLPRHVPTGDAVLEFYRRNVGLGEHPPNSNINWITDWFGVHDAWCNMAVSRALLEAGFTDDGETLNVPGVRQTHFKGWAYVPACAACFADAGLFGDEPRVGSLAICVWPESGDWVDPDWGMPGDHIAVVEHVNPDGTITTWDGNISNAINENTRSRQIFFGFCYPPYQEEELNDEEHRMLHQAARIAERLERVAVDGEGGGVVARRPSEVDLDALAERVAQKVAEKLQH